MKDNKSFWKKAMILALPVAAQNMLATCANMVDTAMVTRLGNAQVTAVGVAGKWIFWMNVIIWGIGAGTSTQISQYWGGDEKHNMRRTQCTALIVSSLIAFIYFVAAASFPETMIRLFNKEPQVIKAGAQYIRIASLGAVPFAIATICATARRAVEDVKIPMYVAGSSVLINTFLNYVFIYGHFGAPALGVRGAAIATATSLGFQAVVFIILGLARKHFSITSLADIRKLDRAFVAKFMKVSLPAGFNEMIWGGGIIICAAVFAKQGSENYAGYTIYDSVSNLAFVFFQGLAAASAVMVGKAVGAGRLDEAYKTAKKFMTAAPIMGFAVGMLLILLKNPILGLYEVETQTAQQIASTLLTVNGFWFFVRVVNYTGVCGIFRAGGDPQFGVILDLIGLYGCAIPAVLLAAYVFKLPFVGIVLTMLIVDDGSKVFITLHHFRSRKWIKKLTQSGYSGSEVCECLEDS